MGRAVRLVRRTDAGAPATAGLDDPGIGILLAAILGTVGYDVGGLFIGKNAGRQPLSAASPNKTVEGLIGGCVVAVVVVVVGSVLGFGPIDTFSEGLLVGLAVAISAPLGDLCQSLVKRDLGVKDMGALLPGHGGLLDRFDSPALRPPDRVPPRPRARLLRVVLRLGELRSPR